MNIRWKMSRASACGPKEQLTSGGMLNEITSCPSYLEKYLSITFNLQLYASYTCKNGTQELD
jgi:hypothetical protein